MPDFAFERKLVGHALKWLNENYIRKQDELESIADAFGEPEALLSNYVEPDCQPGNPANEDDDWSDSYWRVPAFRYLGRFLSSVSDKRDGRNHLFLLGDAGMGKTSLLVVVRLFHLASFFPRHYACSLLKLDKNTETHIASITGRSRHILLLDALDEDESLRDTTIAERLTQIMDLTQSFHKVVVSCRTQFFVDDERDPRYRLGQVRISGYRCPITYLAPFTQEKIDEYLEKRFSGRGIFRSTEEIDTAKRLTLTMGSLRTRPLLLSYIDDLSDMTSDGFVSEYEIYHWLISKWLEREERKLRNLLDTGGPSTDALRAVCTEVAFRMAKKGSRVIEKEEFEDIRRSFDAELFLKDDLIEGRTLLNKNSRGRFRFAHYSLEEFLTVEHIINSAMRGNELDISDISPTEFMARAFRQFVLQALYDVIQNTAFDYSQNVGAQQREAYETLLSHTLGRAVSVEASEGRFRSIDFLDTESDTSSDQIKRIFGGDRAADRLDAIHAAVLRGAELGMVVRQTEVHEWIREHWIVPVG